MSFQIESGAPTARLAMDMTIGRRIPAALKTTSVISKRPCEVVAEYVREPAALAPTQAESAESSFSTVMYSASSWQLATNSARASTIWVWGVIGYAETTCGRQSRTASATACDPSVISIIYFSSCFMVIASLGHSAAQIPQPLQHV